MATNVLGLMDYVQKQGDIGRKQGQETLFNRLAGQAYTAPAAQQGALVGQMVGVDPQAGMAMGSALAGRNQAAETDHMKKLGGAARYMAQALQTKNPQQIEGAYQAVRPYLAEVSGKQPPPNWDPAMEPALYQAIAQTGGTPEQKGVVLSAGGQLRNPMTGELLADNPQALQYHDVPMGEGKAAGVFDPSTGAVRPAVGGVPQGNQQGDPMQPFIEQANHAIQMGAPEDKVRAWLMQQAQQIGAQPQAAGQSPYMASNNAAGLVAPGNIDLSRRPTVKNADGSISTVRSISIGTDKGEVLIPTVIGNRVVSNEEAIRHYQQTGENLGTFDSPQSANAYAETLHEQQARQYLPQQSTAPAQFGIGTPKPSAADQESFGAPQQVMGADGKPHLVQFGNRGGQREVGGYLKPEMTPAQAAKQAVQQQKAEASKADALESYDQSINQIDNLLKSPGASMLGTYIGDVAGMIPHTDTANANAALDNIKNQVLLNTISKLKALSATGASGFGSLSNQEGEILKNSIASLDKKQTNAQLMQNLRNIKSMLQQSRNNVAGKQIEFDAGQGQGAAQPAAPQAGGWAIQRVN